MRSSGAMLLSSAATSSCRHRLQQRFLLVARQVLEDGGGVLPRQHAEGDDLIFDAEVREHGREIVGLAVPDHVAQPGEVALTDGLGQFVGGPGDLPDGAPARRRAAGPMSCCSICVSAARTTS